MTRFLTVNEVCQLHDRAIAQFGGYLGIRDRNALDSAIAQPQMTFGGEYLYRTEFEQATALALYPFFCHRRTRNITRLNGFLSRSKFDLLDFSRLFVLFLGFSDGNTSISNRNGFDLVRNGL